MAKNVEKVIILGAGPAGLTAGIYAGRDGLKPLVVEGLSPGGQPNLTTTIENYPGFPEGIQGPELAQRLRQQAAKFDSRFISGQAASVSFKKFPYQIRLSNGQSLQAQSVIIATGSSAWFLGLPREKALLGHGVSICATCDAPFYKGLAVAVVGGGDTAMIDATALAKVAKRVYIIHRRDKLRASLANQLLLKNFSNIKILWNKTISQIHGADKLSGVTVKDTQTGRLSRLKLNGLFLAIGHHPNTDFLRGKLTLDSHGYVLTHNKVFTSVEGVFAAGDVADPQYQQLASAVGTGCMAALEAENFLRQKK